MLNTPNAVPTGTARQDMHATAKQNVQFFPCNNHLLARRFATDIDRTKAARKRPTVIRANPIQRGGGGSDPAWEGKSLPATTQTTTT